MPGRPPELWLPGSVFRAQEEPLCAPTPTHEPTWEGAFLVCVCFLNLCNQRTRCGHVIREPCPKNPSVRFQPWRLTFHAFTHAQDRREEPKNKRCSRETPKTQSKPSNSRDGWEPAQQFWGAGPRCSELSWGGMWGGRKEPPSLCALSAAWGKVQEGRSWTLGGQGQVSQHVGEGAVAAPSKPWGNRVVLSSFQQAREK